MSCKIILLRTDLPSPAQPAEPGSILVVEDDVLIRLMVADELRSRGFNVVEAQNADEAVVVLQSQIPVALVFTDVQLPGSRNGMSLARLVRETRPELKVVVASGTIDVGQDDARAINAFFRKPYALGKVADCIERFVAGKPE